MTSNRSRTDSPKITVVYIPGLGDTRVTGQRIAVRCWRLWGIEPYLFQMRWQDAEPWDTKFDRLLSFVDALLQEGKTVALVGASAGAAAALTVYAVRKDSLTGCILIAGKVNQPEVIERHYRKENPALVDCVYACERALARLSATDRKRIQTRYAVVDRIVSRADSRIPGAYSHTVLSVGHVATIALQITLGVPMWLRFLKSL